MYAQRVTERRMSPAGLGLAIGINGALLVALAVSAPTIDPLVPSRPIETVNIPLPPPPPPPKPEPSPPVAAKPLPEPEPVTPRPIVDPPIARPDPIGTTDPLPILPPPTLPGAGGGAIAPPEPPPLIVGAEPDPRYAGDLQPEYPPDERRAGHEGSVTVRVLIGADGRVKAVEPVKAASDSFFAATRRQALAHWRFRPATRNGVAFESWRQMTLRFALVD